MLNDNIVDTIKYEDVKHITSKEYFVEDEYACDVFDIKYCQKWAEDGSLITDNTNTYTKIETPADVFMRVASGLAAMEDNEEQREYFKNKWFSLMWLGWFRPGGSVLSGTGSANKKSLLNCTTLPLVHDSLESIAKLDYDIMKTAAFRQGIGFDASSLRPRGSKVNNAAEESTGAVPWINKLVMNGKWVGQKGRMPALLVSLKDHHPDVIEFIKAKSEAGILENANISVQISDAFMEAVEKDDDWELYFEFEDNVKYDRISKTIKARDLFNLIVEMSHKTAEPGVQFIDKLREGYMVHQVYKATGDERFKGISTNACSEKFLAPYGVCNLLSPNMEMFSTDEEEYKQELEYLVPFMVRLSDNVTEYELRNELSPLKEQRWILEQVREVGLGITNIHGWLLKQNIAYDSDEAIDRVEKFFKKYACEVFKSSMDLGREKGNAPAWDLVKDKKHFMGSVYFRNIVNELFDGNYDAVKHMRNLAHMSIAPTGSLSGTFPVLCFSYGVEPVISPYYWRKTRAVEQGLYTYYFIVPKRVKEYVMSKLDKNSEEYKVLESFTGSARDDDGKIGNVIKDIIDKALPKGFFKPAHYIDPIQKIKLMGAIYKWVDAAVSCTYNLPRKASIDNVAAIYTNAFKYGVRAVSIYVDGSREGILIFEDPKTTEANNDSKNNICNDRPSSIVPNCAPKRPKELPCDIIFTSIKGEKWTVLVGLFDGQPYEIFCGSSEDLYLPKSCKKGIIRKQGGGKYELEVTIRRSKVIYKDLADMLMNDEQKTITRILSLSMRHGILPRYIVEQLKKANGNITAFSTAVSRVLSRYIGTYVLTGGDNKCPKCGEESMVFSEGCVKCSNETCGYSRCG